MFTKTKNQILDILKNLNDGNHNYKSLFISPAGYTLIKTYCEKNKINLNKLNFSSNTYLFLSLLGFFNNDDYSISHLKRNKILPIKTINSSDGKDIDDITDEFYKILYEFLGLEKKGLVKNISSMIGELLNNIINHSGIGDYGDNTGEVTISSNYQSGQYYNNDKKFVQISIVDSGKGIFSSVKKKLPEIQNTSDAIEKALEPGFTGGTSLSNSNKNFGGTYNAGIGLTKTLDILKKLNGDLFIGTKDCLYCYNGKKGEDYYLDMPIWVGTFVVFNIYTDTNYEINFDELRTQLLGNIKNNSPDFDININFG